MEEILKLVEEYIKEKDSKKEWVAGKDLVQYAGNYFDEKEYVAAVKTLLGGWLVLNQEGIRFESRFPKRLGKKLGILTNSGSSANLLMLAALTSKRGMNLPKGTKVLTPIAGFPTTINPIIQLGFTPVFVDIELESLNLDLDQVEQKLKEDPEIKVITFAHVLGNPPNMDRVMELVEKYNLIFLEDCCDALGSSYKGQMLGSGINPESFKQDYSGFANAAATQAQGVANLGASIGDTITKVGDQYNERKKEQAEQNKQIKLAENVGKLIVKTMPEYADMINPSLLAISDQNIPLADRVIEALNITEGFKTRLNLEGLVREREMDAMRMQKMRNSMQPAAPIAPAAPVSFFDQ
jgi:hypothetical protein